MDIIGGLAKLMSAPREAKQVIHAGPRIQPSTADRPIRRTWSFAEAVKDGYKRSVLVYRAIFSYALSVSSLPAVVEVKRGQDWEPAEEAGSRDQLGQAGVALQTLLSRPSESFSFDEIQEALSIHLLLAGVGYVEKTTASGRPRWAAATRPPILEMEPMVPAGFSPMLDRQGRLARFEFRHGSVHEEYAIEDIVYFRLMDPEKLFDGMSPLLPAAGAVDTDNVAQDWNRHSMENRNVADIALIYKDWLSEEQHEMARKRLKRQKGPEAAHDALVMGGDWDLKVFGKTAVEMDFIASRKFYREEVLSAFSVPPVVAGYFENATLANAEVSRRLYWDDTILPFVMRMRNRWEHSLVPHFGAPGTIRILFDTSAVDALKENITEKAATLKALQEAGVTYNEAIEILELPVSPKAKIGDIPFGVLNEAAIAPAIQLADRMLPGRRMKALRGKANAPRSAQRREARETAEILAVADSIKPGIRRLFLDAVDELAVGAGALAGLIRDGDLDRLALAFPLDDLVERLASGLDEALRKAHAGAGARAMGHLEDFIDEALEVFDEGLSVLFASARAREAATLIAESTRRAITGLADAIDAGDVAGSADELAELAAAHWGVNSNQGRSLRKLWREADEPLTAVTGAVAGILEDRAENIAEYEAVTAAYDGRQKAWNQVADRFTEFVKIWVHAGDKDVDEECLVMGGVEAPANEPFDTPLGPAEPGPGYHAGPCRCGAVIWRAELA